MFNFQHKAVLSQSFYFLSSSKINPSERLKLHATIKRTNQDSTLSIMISEEKETTFQLQEEIHVTEFMRFLRVLASRINTENSETETEESSAHHQ